MILPSYYSPNIKHVLGKLGHLNTRITEADNLEHSDILILGSSHAYRGLDTRIISKLGKSTFNIGSNSQTPVQSKILAERYLSKLNPELVLFEVYPMTFTMDGVESSLDLISNSDMDLSLARLVLEHKNPKVLNTAIYASVRQVLNLDESFIEEKTNKTGTYISGGFVEAPLKTYQYESYEEQKWNFEQSQFDALDRTLKLIESTGAKCILLYSPITSNNYNSYTNQAYFDSLMKTKANYIDFNPLVQLDDSLHFYDSHHLNQSGVELYNNELVQVLDSLGFMD